MSLTRMVLVTVLVFITCAPSAQARKSVSSDVMKVIQKYDRCDGVDSIVLGPFLMWIARLAASGDEEAEILKHVDRMAVFSAAQTEDGLRPEIERDLKLALDGYETFVEMKDGEEDMTVYMNMPAENVISEMVLVSRSELSVIVMTGDLPVSVLENIVADASAE